MRKSAFQHEINHLDASDIAFIDACSDSYGVYGEYSGTLPSELPEGVTFHTEIDDDDLAFGMSNRLSVAL